ncbi:Protein of unknown function [Marivirga sericea]|uniref:DUF2851 domain-containing protein n=1 Tax=Marivirga sericea TaxID=1028 RepID=A0A1X7KDF9_9BACT|nr:DUF2851 family protein [Marivirga sericea]SMG39257.1 Protein of unknown function [Marivirga sericea]
MKEDFLHYVWRYQKFDKSDLVSTDGSKVKTINAGFGHTHAGPDFQQAKVFIDDIEWNGAVEIHIKSSDWNRHKHQLDPSYENVILHVVWQNDKPIQHPDGSNIPTIELKNRVDYSLIEKYQQLKSSKDEIPCTKHWIQTSDLFKIEMFEKVLVERLHQKSNKVKKHFEEVCQDWDQASYFMLLSAMGFKVNQHPFERLAEVLPFSLLKKYSSSIFQLEALLFGAAGFLSQDFEDDYPNELRQEWQFLKHKHKSVFSGEMNAHEWRFLRLRPANFPTIRIAELAQILHISPSLFDAFVINMDLKVIQKKLRATLSDYWLNHYQFDRQSKFRLKQLGQTSLKTLIINCIPPLLALYAKSIGEDKYMDKAITLLNDIKAEKNYITKKFTVLGKETKSAFDSQAMIQLHNEYCQPKKCLDCSIGLSIFKR